MGRALRWTGSFAAAAAVLALAPTTGCIGDGGERGAGVALSPPRLSAKGGLVVGEGGGAACGPDPLATVAAAWDSLPFAPDSPIYRDVEVVLVPRARGSATDWTVDPIRIEIADYPRCETIEMVLVHELGHALRALYLDRAGEFPAGDLPVDLGLTNADDWATFLGYWSWADLAPVAAASCGIDGDHCALPTDELFADMVRATFFPVAGPAATTWCKGTTPCWIYGFYSQFPDPRTIPGYRDWLVGLTTPPPAE